MAITVNCDQVSVTYITKALYDIPTWLETLWSCSVFVCERSARNRL